MPSAVSVLRLDTSERMRLSISLRISCAQLTSSRGTLISGGWRKAQLTRSAQFLSICSLSADLSRPSSKYGPICSRDSVASSRTTGSGASP